MTSSESEFAMPEDGQPGATDGQQESAGVQEFSLPTDAPGDEDVIPGASNETPAASRLTEVYDALVSAMAAGITESGTMAMAADLEGAGNIQGVGISVMDGGSLPGEPVLTVYVAEPTTEGAVRAAMAEGMGIQSADASEVPVDICVTGVIDARPHRMRIRPAPGGVSIGHCKVTAGTLGCLARGRAGTDRFNRLLLLSNNHVIANSNDAKFGDWIIQPGSYDGGKCTANDRIAILERFVPISFSGARNYVDCATGWCWPNLVRRELMYMRGTAPQFFRVGGSPGTAQKGMWVGKTGRTTQLTRGYITDVNATIRVNYGGGRVALFADQMAIRAPSGDFSAGGDSGSLIWTWNSARTPVGLLFAGGGGVTFANKLTRAVAALGIQLYT